MKRFLLAIILIFVLATLGGCTNQAPSFSATELAKLYQEKPEEFKKIKTQKITVSGKVLIKNIENNQHSLTLSILGTIPDGRTIVELNLPAEKVDQFKSLKIGDIIEFDGTIKEVKIDGDKNKNTIIIESTQLKDKVTLEKEYPKIPEYTAEAIYENYKNNPEIMKPLEGQVIRVKGKILKMNYFTNNAGMYADIYTEGRWNNLGITIPKKLEDKFLQMDNGTEVEVYGVLYGRVPQLMKEKVFIQVITTEFIK